MYINQSSVCLDRKILFFEKKKFKTKMAKKISNQVKSNVLVVKKVLDGDNRAVLQSSSVNDTVSAFSNHVLLRKSTCRNLQLFQAIPAAPPDVLHVTLPAPLPVPFRLFSTASLLRFLQLFVSDFALGGARRRRIRSFFDLRDLFGEERD